MVDNPGIFFKVDLEDSCLENKELKEIRIDKSDEDWMFVLRKGNNIEACGDVTKFKALIESFLCIAEQKEFNFSTEYDEFSDWFSNWALKQAGEDMHFESKFQITTVGTPGFNKWYLLIEFYDYMSQYQDSYSIIGSTDEVRWSCRDNIFEATCNLGSLSKTLKIFKKLMQNLDDFAK